MKMNNLIVMHMMTIQTNHEMSARKGLIGESPAKPVLWLALWWLGLMVLAFPLAAQEPIRALTVQQAVEYARQHSRTIHSSRMDERIAKEKTKEVLSSGLPQVNINGRYTDNLEIPTQLIPAVIAGGPEGQFIPVQFGTKYSTTAGIEATQLLFSQSYMMGLKASKLSQDFYQLNTRKTEEGVAFNVSVTYYQAQISQKQLDILQRNLVSTNRLVQISQLQYENGVLKQTDFNRIKVNRTNLETELQNLETAYAQQLNLLKFYMGMSLATEVRLDTTIDENLNNTLLINRDLNLFQNRTEYQLLNKQQELYKIERKNINGGYVPTLSAFANYNYQAFRQNFNFFESSQPWFRSSAIGLSLNIPVFDGLEKRARSQQSRINLEKTANEAELLRESITMEITNANNKLDNSRRQLAAQKENRQLAEQVYTQSQLEFKEGTASLSDLLNAETGMKQAQNNYINALINLQIANLELQKANGTLLGQ
jgi:outer membrane protein